MSSTVLDRRTFVGAAASWLGGAAVAASPMASLVAPPKRLFDISLAEWSLHRTLRKGELSNLDFPQRAAAYGIHAVEYVNRFFQDKADDAGYLTELKKRCDGEGVESLLIMCDGEGALGAHSDALRRQAVDNHKKWVRAAKALGCHSIRVNAQSAGSFEEQQRLAADGLRKLCEYADDYGVHILVENHGGLSSHGKWLRGTLKLVDHRRIGALPDFGNFRISRSQEYDRYLGVDELMPFAKGVSAKSHDFDERGNEVHTDYRRMLEIVVIKHGYRGHIGVEYEGGKLSEHEGIRHTQ
ncbi:MAG TPA: sugar phosphate isomerase/epimerase, partial [bacterium]|nr:sugar phosphate isomerase/epimerase [bacterium]